MTSALYVGRLRHRRFSPTSARVPLPRLPDVPGPGRNSTPSSGAAGCGPRAGPAIAWFRRADHLGDPAQPLDDRRSRPGRRPHGRAPDGADPAAHPSPLFRLRDEPGQLLLLLRSVRHPRGDDRGRSQQHALGRTALLRAGRRDAGPGIKRYALRKAFHVSPFMPMDIDYDWRFSDPEDRLTVHMVNLSAGRPVFDATLTLTRRPITGWQLARVLAVYPLMTAAGDRGHLLAGLPAVAQRHALPSASATRRSQRTGSRQT